MTVQRLTLENCWIEYTYQDGRVVLFGYAGNPERVIKELLEKYLLPPKQYIVHPYCENHPAWGENAPYSGLQAA